MDARCRGFLGTIIVLHSLIMERRCEGDDIGLTIFIVLVPINNGSAVHINIGEVYHALGTIKSFRFIDPISIGLLEICKEIFAA